MIMQGKLRSACMWVTAAHIEKFLGEHDRGRKTMLQLHSSSTTVITLQSLDLEGLLGIRS